MYENGLNFSSDLGCCFKRGGSYIHFYFLLIKVIASWQGWEVERVDATRAFNVADSATRLVYLA